MGQAFTARSQQNSGKERTMLLTYVVLNSTGKIMRMRTYVDESVVGVPY